MIAMLSLEQLSLAELSREASRETQQFREHRPTDGAHAFELFRRAIVRGDECAWSDLYQLYRNLVSSWILCGAPAAMLVEEQVPSLINAAFTRFARGVSPQKFANFPTLEMLLGYLKRCTRSVLFDELRRRQMLRSREIACEVPLDVIEQEPIVEDPAELFDTHLASQEVWTIVAQAVPSQAERLILMYVCVLGWRSQELQRLYPALYPSIDDVYRIKRNVIARLQRNRQLRALAAGRAS
jgi:hypothetical protein